MHCVFQLAGRQFFYDISQIHDDNLIGKLSHQRNIVADKQNCHSLFSAQTFQQCNYLCLYRYIQCTGRLITDQQGRRYRQSTRDYNTLQFSAAELMRKLVQHIFIQFNPVQQFFNSAADLFFFAQPPIDKWFPQKAVDPHPWADCSRRILQHQLHFPPQLLPFLTGKPLFGRREFLSQYPDATFDNQFDSGHHPDKGTLSASGFPDNCNRFTLLHRQANTVDRH